MFNIGDVVRKGNGKVEYVVAAQNADGSYTVESMNTGKPSVEEASRLTLVRAAETEPMNVSQGNVTVELVEETGEAFDPRVDRRQSAYGLMILQAVLRKNPAALRMNTNALKPIGSKRPKVRSKVKAQRDAKRRAATWYNREVRNHGYNIAA